MKEQIQEVAELLDKANHALYLIGKTNGVIGIHLTAARQGVAHAVREITQANNDLH